MKTKTTATNPVFVEGFPTTATSSKDIKNNNNQDRKLTTMTCSAGADAASTEKHQQSGDEEEEKTKKKTNDYQARISTLVDTIFPVKPRVLKEVRGSGNYGESNMSQFWIYDELPTVLTTMMKKEKSENEHEHEHGSSYSQRRSSPRKATVIDDKKSTSVTNSGDGGTNGHEVFYVDNVLSDEECDALAACAEYILKQNGYSRYAPGINTPPGMRVNQAAHWFPSQQIIQDGFLTDIYHRLEPFLPSTVTNNGQTLSLYPKLSQKVAQFKYDKGDEFKPHVDGLFPGQGSNVSGNDIEEWPGIVSGYSLLFFLNDSEKDGLEGGATRVWSADRSQNFDIQPKKGRVLVFRRGSPDAVLHAGRPVNGQVPKYMALINALYGPPP